MFRYLVFLTLFVDVEVLDNGVAKTPPMGWMSWGYYMCDVLCKNDPENCLNEKLILSVADTFYNEGYLEAGYQYIIIDDCWSEPERDENGRLVADRQKFPNGMKYIADYIHSRGLKFGMYTNIADVTCMHYPGSKGHFELDAMTFAEWDIDYLKVDGCFVTEEYLNKAYIKLGKHLNGTGRPIVYSCSWPYYIEFIHKKIPNYNEVARHCNMWRNFHDVTLDWKMIKYILQHYMGNYKTFSEYHKPGQWNDPDMLIIGAANLTEGQNRVHMSVYAMLSAPLLLSCDMRKITPFQRTLLTNLDLIAIGQDPLGIMAEPHILKDNIVLWVKRRLPMKGNLYHAFSFAIVNFSLRGHHVTFFPKEYGLTSTDGYTVMNAFTGKYVGNTTLNDAVNVFVPKEDVVLYTFYPL